MPRVICEKKNRHLYQTVRQFLKENPNSYLPDEEKNDMMYIRL